MSQETAVTMWARECVLTDPPIHFLPLVQFRVVVGLELIPGVRGQEAGFTVPGSGASHRLSHSDTTTVCGLWQEA